MAPHLRRAPVSWDLLCLDLTISGLVAPETHCVFGIVASSLFLFSLLKEIKVVDQVIDFPKMSF